MEKELSIASQFVPFELAVKLKELGFDEPTLAGYRDYNGIKLMTRVKDNTYPLVSNSGFGKYCHQNKHIVKAPTWQQAFDWFREKYNLDSYVRKTTYKQWKLQINYLLQDDSPEEWEKYKSYQDYKDTKEEIRQVCLEKLIEIVTENK